MRFRRAFGALSALTASWFVVLPVSTRRLNHRPPLSPGRTQGETRRAQIERVKEEALRAMDAGSHRNATLDMIPYVVFRVLQEIEPATFRDDALNANGRRRSLGDYRESQDVVTCIGRCSSKTIGFELRRATSWILLGYFPSDT